MVLHRFWTCYIMPQRGQINAIEINGAFAMAMLLTSNISSHLCLLCCHSTLSVASFFEDVGGLPVLPVNVNLIRECLQVEWVPRVR